jgi:hypothetical protein
MFTVKRIRGDAPRRWLVASAVSILMLAGGVRDGVGPRRLERGRSRPRTRHVGRSSTPWRDDDAHGLEGILGPELTSSGAESEGRLERQRFDAKYREMHRLVREPDGTTRLYVGAENWPFPVPLVAEGGRWRFDTDAGQREILLRRGATTRPRRCSVCEALARTTQHRPDATGDDPIARYARRLLASPTVAPLRKSPSTATTIESCRSARPPQKARALAYVAYPAEYRASGVMTFVVTDDGALWEKDLGPATPMVAPDLSARPRGGAGTSSRRAPHHAAEHFCAFSRLRGACRIRIGCDDIRMRAVSWSPEGREPMTEKIAPCLWFDGRAEEAAHFYASHLPDSHVDAIHRAPADYPSGKKGDVLTVEFTLAGRKFVGLNGGPHFTFNEASRSRSTARIRPRWTG